MSYFTKLYYKVFTKYKNIFLYFSINLKMKQKFKIYLKIYIK